MWMVIECAVLCARGSATGGGHVSERQEGTFYNEAHLLEEVRVGANYAPARRGARWYKLRTCSKRCVFTPGIGYFQCC